MVICQVPTFDYENEISWIHPSLPHVKENFAIIFQNACKQACLHYGTKGWKLETNIARNEAYQILPNR